MSIKPPLKFSLFQFNPVWEHKEANLEKLDELLNVVSDDTQIVVLPEMFSTGYTMNTDLAEPMDGKTMTWMRNSAINMRKILVGSMIIREDKLVYNRLIWMLPTGVFHYYDKRHLFGFAGENDFYQPGQKRTIVQVNGWKIGLRICYDLRFPVWNRQQEPLYDVLLFVSSWPDSRISHWDTLLSARAIENQAYVVGVNRVGYDGKEHYHSGHSRIISPMGEIMTDGGNREDIVLSQTLSYEVLEDTRRRFPFLKDADNFQIF